jgi:hypothetical protein
MNRGPLRKARSRRPLGTPEFLNHGFLDSRSYIETRTGRVVLFGADKTNLRREVYARAGGRCENVLGTGKRCNKYASWDGVGKGDLAHVTHRGKGGSDTLENTRWNCRECHKQQHPGPQWSPLIRGRVEAGDDPQELEPRVDTAIQRMPVLAGDSDAPKQPVDPRLTGPPHNPFNRSKEERAALGVITRYALWFQSQPITSFTGDEVASILISGWQYFEFSKAQTTEVAPSKELNP